MRTIVFFFMIAVGLACGTSRVSAATNPWCFGVFPVDIMDCKDRRLRALHKRVGALHEEALSRAKGAKRQALLEEQNSWWRSRGAKCGVRVIEWVTDQSAQRARPCLARVYQARITRLSQSLTPNEPESDSQTSLHSDTAKNVIACYKAGNETVADMYACAGVWVTPRILTLCFLQADCPVIDDRINASSVVNNALGPDNLNTKLSIEMKYVLSVPNRRDIEECKGTGSATVECVAPRMIHESMKPLTDCGTITEDKGKALCLSKQVSKELLSVTECMSAKGGGTAAFSECTESLPWAKVQDVQKCAISASANAKVDCLLVGADPAQRELAKCLSSASGQAAVALDCLSKSNPQMADKIAVASCAANAVDKTAAASCFTTVLDGDAKKIAECAKGGKDKMVSCLLGDRPEYKAAAQAVACVQGGRDASSLITNCSDFLIKDPKARAVLACAAQASDSSKLAACAASTVLPPEVARYAACAATSQGGATNFALCAAGSQMNEEWRIAAECAVQSGGEPFSFAGCTAGRLTLRELTKCFTGGSCYGPNNTIVKAYTNAFNDVLHGPGANNEIVVALGKLREATGGPNSVINKPEQIFGGENSVFRKPRQIFGGDHSVINEFIDKPLGGSCSLVRRPLGC
ncbi:hypothetical protein [Bradyrhizobium sp. sGM-13]|uniref:hypothetical protein n=1 Tax=Bradyrhizobium sp. sGM-13 TaxID=2831781 RepID=UPI001BCEEBBA|nr:hypothetical protein [Bradyrhizobium sp. sGM-13]